MRKIKIYFCKIVELNIFKGIGEALWLATGLDGEHYVHKENWNSQCKDSHKNFYRHKSLKMYIMKWNCHLIFVVDTQDSRWKQHERDKCRRKTKNKSKTFVFLQLVYCSYKLVLIENRKCS